MRRNFVTLDVFTDRRFAGNPLAVVLDAEGLDAAAMQAIAREFSHPETVFVLHAGRSRASGAASHLHADAGIAVRRPSDRRDGGAARPARRRRRRPRLRARGGDRPDPLHARDRAAPDAAAPASRLPQLPAETGPAADDATIAAALGLAPADIGFAGFRPARWSAGNPFTFVPVAGLAAIARCRADLTRFDDAFPRRRRLHFLRRDRRAGPRFPCQDVRARFRYRRGSRDRIGRRRLRRAHCRARRARRRRPRDRHRAGLRDGPPQPDPARNGNCGPESSYSASIGGDAVIVTEGTIEA